jgi:hypothetical protein
MSDLLVISSEVLRNFGYSVIQFEHEGHTAACFEDETTLGFVFTYTDADALISMWAPDIAKAASRHSLALRRAGQKAWNVYAIFLGGGNASETDAMRLSFIEEDLTATRKLARAGLKDTTDVREALLTLLPLQNAPLLEAVDMSEEIRLRASELPARVLDAFLSNSDESVVLQVLEEEQ